MEELCRRIEVRWIIFRSSFEGFSPDHSSYYFLCSRSVVAVSAPVTIFVQPSTPPTIVPDSPLSLQPSSIIPPPRVGSPLCSPTNLLAPRIDEEDLESQTEPAASADAGSKLSNQRRDDGSVEDERVDWRKAEARGENDEVTMRKALMIGRDGGEENTGGGGSRSLRESGGSGEKEKQTTSRELFFFFFTRVLI